MSAPKRIIPPDFDNTDAAHFAVGYLSSAVKQFLDGHHDVDLLRNAYDKLTAAFDERDGRRPVPAVSEQPTTAETCLGCDTNGGHYDWCQHAEEATD